MNMIDNEKYQKELIRMWDSVRDDNKGYPGCRGVKCKKCPLYDIKWDDIGCGDSIYAVKMINIVEKWSNEHPQKHKISQLEYDILKMYSDNYFYYFYESELLKLLLKKGCFKGATSKTNIINYLNNCEVVENEG